MAFEKGNDLAPRKFTSAHQPANRGRPKGSRNVATVLSESLLKLAPDVVLDREFIREFCRDKKRVTSADAIAARLLYEAIYNGEAWAIKEVLDRTEGKAKQAVQLGDPNGDAVPVKIIQVIKPDGV